MGAFRKIAVRAALIVLGLSELLHAQQVEVPLFETDGPQFCPPLNQYLTPTLLDVFIYPGISFR